MSEPKLLEVGKVHRTHGLNGELSVSFVSNRPERWTKGARLQIDGQWLTLETVRTHQNRMLVRFSGLVERTMTEKFIGKLIYAESIEDPEALWIHELIGSSVIDVHANKLGTVADIIDNPASDLIRMENGVLIPMVFVTNFNRDKGEVEVDLPEGLLDL